MKVLGRYDCYRAVQSFRNQLIYQSQIVPRHSAVTGVLGDEIKLDASHSDMCRFDLDEKTDRQNYRKVEANLRNLCEFAIAQGTHKTDMGI